MRERWKRRPSATFAPSISISTVTASFSSPGRSDEARLESASGSIGSTAPGTYTLVAAAHGLALERATGAQVGGHVGDVHPHARCAPFSRRAEMASSKSWASSGSIVNVGSAVRSTRASAA